MRRTTDTTAHGGVTTAWRRRTITLLASYLALSTAFPLVASSASASPVSTQSVASHDEPARPAAPSGPPGFSDSVVLGVAAPTALTWTPDGRMLVTGQAGRLTVVRDGEDSVALDLRPRICAQRERGLLGVAVDPAFVRNHFIYLYYTHRVGGACGGKGRPLPQSRVGRFVLRDDDTVDPRGEKIIVDHLMSPAPGHLAGDLEFGDDRYLYISVGDGVCSLARPRVCGPLNPNAQDRTLPLGKILRVNRNGAPPRSNPFAGRPQARRCAPAGRLRAGSGPCKEIFALGFRNPFRLARRPGTNTFFVNDVGLDTWEEVDRLRRGGNYGWNLREGHCRRDSATRCGRQPGYLDPIHDYRHANRCRSITGGAFVPRGLWPGFDGAYLFADFACGRVFRLVRDTSGRLVRRSFLSGLSGPTHLRFGPHGGTSALFYASYFGNAVHRVTRSRTNTTPVADFEYVPDGRTILFNGSASSDPDVGDEVTRWHWDFGDGTVAETSASRVSHTYAATGAFEVTLRVEDSAGAVSTPLTRTAHSGEHPPSLQITDPADATRFAVGQRVQLAALANDPEDGDLSGSSISWTVRLHHANHSHPFAGPVSGSSIVTRYPAPENLRAAASSRLVATATATDSHGIRTTVRRVLAPRKVRLTFDARPRGARVMVQGMRQSTRFTVTSWKGYRFPVLAPDQRIGGDRYVFRRWADGGRDRRRVIDTPTLAATYVARFVRR